MNDEINTIEEKTFGTDYSIDEVVINTEDTINEDDFGFDYPIDEEYSINDVFVCDKIPTDIFVGLSRCECLLFINKVLDQNLNPLTFDDMKDDILCQSITNIVGKFTVKNKSEYTEDPIFNSSVDGWDKWRCEWNLISFFSDQSEDGKRMFNISLFGRDGLDGEKSVFEWDQIRSKGQFEYEESIKKLEDFKQGN